MSRGVRALACLVVVLLIAPGLLRGGAVDGSRVHVVLLKGALDRIDVDVEEVYPSFVLGYVDAGVVGRVSEYVLDVLEDVDVRSTTLPGTADYVVVFRGPVKPEWDTALKETGAEVTPLVPRKYGCVVIASENEAETIVRLPFVRAVYPYMEKVQGDIPPVGSVRVVVTFFPGHGGSWGDILQAYDDPVWGGYIITEVDASSISRLASDPGVARIEPWRPAAPFRDEVSDEPLNDVSRWVIQSFIQGQTPIWDRGIHGEGVVVGVSDTGVDYDHMNFRDTMNDMGTPGPNHRKVVRLTNYAGNGEDSLPHGSHVVGTILGKSLDDPNAYVKYDGMAYNARVSFMDIFDLSQTQNEIMPPMKEMLDDMYTAGARSHSGSWGGFLNQSAGAYSWRSLGADRYMWDHPDFLGIWAAGNSGPSYGSVSEPGTAKNIVTVGASSNGNTKNIASFSSNGPTKDGVRKPTIVAPGVSIVSVSGDSTLGNYNSGYRSMSGTSMATPTAAGAAALVEQYFREGFYPSGTKNLSEGFMPSGPLRKAVLINSAWDQYGGTNVDSHIPDNSQGWGKIKLDDALYFAGDARKLWVDDAAYDPGLNTGESVEYLVNASGGEPLKVTLVWNDYPGNGLINDMDLRVVAPDSTIYLGNVFSNGESSTGGQPDRSNNDEQVLVSSPLQGTWSVNVLATDVPKGPQPYSLVITGDLIDVKKSGSSAPAVISTDPRNKAASVPRSKNISVTFDRQMNTSSAEAAFSTLPTTNGNFTWTGPTMTFVPSALLDFNTTYTVTIAKTARDASGKSMASDYTFSFTTVENTPVEVLGTVPMDGSSGIPPNTTIKVVFDREVVPSTAESALSSSPAMTGTFTWPNGYTMVLTPDTPLRESTRYRVTISRNVSDPLGNTMRSDHRFSFTTGLGPDTTPPTVKITAPSDGDALTGTVQVSADASDDREVHVLWFYLDGAKVSSSFIEPYVWTWDTLASTDGSHTIRVEVSDHDGNTASDSVAVTVSNDRTPPRVLSTMPEDGAADIDRHTVIVITFSEEMDRASAEMAFEIVPSVAGRFSWNGTAMVFLPEGPLTPAQTYHVRVTTLAMDISGLHLQNETRITFTVGGEGSGPTLPPLGTLLLVVGVILAVVGALLFMVMWRRRGRPRTIPGHDAPRQV